LRYLDDGWVYIAPDRCGNYQDVFRDMLRYRPD